MKITKQRFLNTTFLVVLTLLMRPAGVKAQHRDSLDIKIGQMILVGFPGMTVDPKVLEEVRLGKVGSIIFFEKNVPPQNSFVALKKVIWAYQRAAAIPLFIGIDQEGGRVNRLKDKYGFPRSITAAAMAKSANVDSVRFYGEATASTLAGLGFNLNFAPVVDLASNPDNPIIAKYGRAFSANEDTVIRMATEFIKEHHKYGVLTSLKHFPGHGSSKDDTHNGIADVTTTWEERELKPYQVLVDSGLADAIMTSHIVNRKLDKNGNPGTLSSDILTGVLRNRMKFNGVVITDDMQMHAITKYYGLEEAIKLAINAGVDVMTFSNNIQGSEERTVDKVHSIIRKLVSSGEIREERISESYGRIMKLKSRLSADVDSSRYWQEIEKTNRALEEAKRELRIKDEKIAALEEAAKATPEKKSKKKNRR